MAWTSVVGWLATGTVALLVAALGAYLAALSAMFLSVSAQKPTARQLAEEDFGAHPLFRHLPALRTQVPLSYFIHFSRLLPESTCCLSGRYTRASGLCCIFAWSAYLGTHAGYDCFKIDILICVVFLNAGATDTNQCFHWGCQVAWRQLGDFPTPVHTCTLRCPELRASFHVKREDLSSTAYGGNKVRTLQHQLASCEAYAEAHPGARFMAVGSGGSNLCVAAIVHGRRALGMDMTAIWALPDAPELDNTLNMMSGLSFEGAHLPWSKPFEIVNALLAVLTGAAKGMVLHAGGNSITGILGQVAGALEYAEQVARHEAPDPTAIILPLGSSCTITGLIIGITLVRRLGTLPAFQNPALKLVGVPVHHAAARLHNATGFYTSRASRYLALTPQHGIRAVCSFLRSKGCLDLEQDALRFLQEHVEIAACRDVVGTYGAHSNVSQESAHLYEEHGSVTDAAGHACTPLWLCGHFTAKAFAVLLRRLREEASAREAAPGAAFHHSSLLLWHTKSAVQPQGPVDEWQRFLHLAAESGSLFKWAMDGKPTSRDRIGTVLAEDGCHGYRHLMTRVR